MWPTRLFVLRPALVFVSLALIGVAGVISLMTIVQQQFPNIDFPTITVRSSYPGGSTNFTVEAILANPGYRLKSGMAVTGTIDLPVVTGIGVPATAFLDDSHQSVMVVNADGTAKVAKVQERGSDGKTSVVTGIAQGTKVISNGQLGITAGQQIGGSSPAPQSPAP